MQKQHIKLDLKDRLELESLLSKSSLTVKRLFWNYRN